MELFVVSNQLFMDDMYATSDPINAAYGTFPVCNVCNSALGLREWMKPLHVKLSKRRQGDFTFGSVFPLLLSKRAKEVLEASGMHGIERIRPVQVVGTKEELFHPTLSRGRLLIDEKASGFVRDAGEICAACHTGGVIQNYRRLVPITTTMDDNDIFTLAQLPGTIVVSSLFVELVRSNNLSNLEVTPIAEYSCPYSGV